MIWNKGLNVPAGNLMTDWLPAAQGVEVGR